MQGRLWPELEGCPCLPAGRGPAMPHAGWRWWISQSPLPPRSAPPAPFSVTVSAHLKVSSAFGEDPWVTLKHRDS